MKKSALFSMILTIFLLLAGCNLPQRSSPTRDLAGIVASTQTAMAVSQFLTSTSAQLEISPTGPASSTLESTPAGATPQPLQLTPLAPSTVGAPPPAASASCTNAAKFEAETVSDGSVFASGQEFMKTWILRNTGTCTWSPDYALVYIRGDQMSGTSPSPIGQSVPPGGTIQIYLPQRAPASSGAYQGFWKLRSPSGQEFGLGANADVAFWVKIQVAAGQNQGTAGAPFGGPQNLGAPTSVISFEGRSSPWYLGTSSGIDYDVQDGPLVVTSQDPTGDQWRVAKPGFLDDFYLQGSFKTGGRCSGKDGYGFLVRAPEKPNGNINSGYVFSFSCDGNYRVYRMDNGNYTAIQNWTTNPSVIPGATQSNVLGIYAKGDHFQLYANGILIYEFYDSGYTSGLLGLMIRSEATSNFQFSLDEVAIWRAP